jgi:hypothetical protein
VLPDGAPSDAAAPPVRSFGFARADVAADFPVHESERMRHHITDVG